VIFYFREFCSLNTHSIKFLISQSNQCHKNVWIYYYYFFKNIKSLHFCKMILWWLCFIIVDIMKMMHKSFKFFMKVQVKAWWFFFIVSMNCRVLIFNKIAVNFCFFCSLSCWRITYVSCSLISRESSFSAFSLSDFIMQRSFSDIIFHKIETSLFQLCYDYVAVIMLEHQIIISKKSLK